MNRSHRFALVIAALAGCRERSNPVEPPVIRAPAGVTIVSGPGPDTIESIATVPLAIQVGDANGRALSGATVQFFTRLIQNPDTLPGPYATTLVRFGDPGATQLINFADRYSTTTDAEGRAAVQIRRGPLAGAAIVFISVIGGSAPLYVDTAFVPILPGAPTSTLALPRDTSMYADRTLRLRGSVVDRYRNLRSEPVAYAAGPTLAVTPDGMVSASRYARSFVVVSSAFGVDTTRLSVVPHGRLIGVYNYAGGGPLAIVNTDGSEYRGVPGLKEDVSASPHWAPDGKRFVFTSFVLSRDSGGELFLADSTGATTRLLPAGTFRNSADPRYSSDGAWIYFSGQNNDRLWSLWRIHPDGTGAQQLGNNLGGANVDWRPSPSPDQSRVAFTTQGSNVQDNWGIRVATLPAGPASSWIVPGITARWSPDGDRLAVMPDGPLEIKIIDPDGVILKTIPLAAKELHEHAFDWSPDGKWLVFSYDDRLHLLEVDTGLLLPLEWSKAMTAPSWRD